MFIQVLNTLQNLWTPERFEESHFRTWSTKTVFHWLWQ